MWRTYYLDTTALLLPEKTCRSRPRVLPYKILGYRDTYRSRARPVYMYFMCSKTSVCRKIPGLTPLLGLHLFDPNGICRSATTQLGCGWIAEMPREQEAYCFCGVIKALSLRLNQFLGKASDLPALGPFSQMASGIWHTKNFIT